LCDICNLSPNSEKSRGKVGQCFRFFRDFLDEHFSEEESRRQLETAIQWGRYAEIFDYDSASGKLKLTEG